MELLHIISCGYGLRGLYVQSPREDLEPIAAGPLLQQQCVFSSHWNLQRDFGLRHPDSSHACPLAASDTNKDENVDDRGVCDRVFVRLHEQLWEESHQPPPSSRACVTSILRTYYSWKIYKSEDISYNMIIMGFWTYAEIAIGITVSCLPVIPRFFHHFGPKIRTLVLSRYKSSATSGNKSASTGSTPKIKTVPKLSDASTTRGRGTMASDPWDNSTTHIKGDYITLDDYDERPVVPPKSYKASQITASYLDGAARMRDDVERGHADVS